MPLSAQYRPLAQSRLAEHDPPMMTEPSTAHTSAAHTRPAVQSLVRGTSKKLRNGDSSGAHTTPANGG